MYGSYVIIQTVQYELIFKTRYVINGEDNHYFVARQDIIVHEFLHWPDAVQYCTDINGRLMEIRTQQQYDEAAPYVSGLGWFWLGASDADNEGIWRWESDGSLVDMTMFWASGSPSNADNQDYMYLRAEGFDDNWNVNRLKFFCQFD